MAHAVYMEVHSTEDEGRILAKVHLLTLNGRNSSELGEYYVEQYTQDKDEDIKELKEAMKKFYKDECPIVFTKEFESI